jgi:uncharacterized protein YeaO (DUF488 family)
MLIEQMKLHPEEFKGFAGKFTSMLDRAHDVLHNSAIRGMSKRDATAVLAAAEEHLYEVWLAEDVLTSIMQPKPNLSENTIHATPNKLGVWQGAVPPGSVITANIGSSHSITAQYDQAYQMELARYKEEIARQRQQDNEYAMRLTKPFRKFE